MDNTNEKMNNSYGGGYKPVKESIDSIETFEELVTFVKSFDSAEKLYESVMQNYEQNSEHYFKKYEECFLEQKKFKHLRRYVSDNWHFMKVLIKLYDVFRFGKPMRDYSISNHRFLFNTLAFPWIKHKEASSLPFFDFCVDIFENIDDYVSMFNCLVDEKSKQLLAGILKCRISGDCENVHNYSDFPAQQYLDSAFINCFKEEVICDVGGFTADTLILLLKRCHEKIDKVLFFEPNRESMISAKRNILSYQQRNHCNTKIDYYEVGLSNRNTLVNFCEEGAGSHVLERDVDVGKSVIRLTKMDDLNLGFISCIKMDIEGEELNALDGCIETIQENHPKLAICVYHYEDDLWQIFKKINKEFSFYRYYIRQYGIDIVLYAIPM